MCIIFLYKHFIWLLLWLRLSLYLSLSISYIYTHTSTFGAVGMCIYFQLVVHSFIIHHSSFIHLHHSCFFFSLSFSFHQYFVRLRLLFQSEFNYPIWTDFGHIHGRTVRADGNCVRILKIAPMIDNLFGVWIDGEASDWNLW